MAEAPVTRQAARSPTAQSCSRRARRCRHHLPRPIDDPSRRAVYGAGSHRWLKKGKKVIGNDDLDQPSAREFASKAHDTGELVRPVRHESSEPGLLRQHALARGAEHETRRHQAVAIEDGRGDARSALCDLVHGNGEPGAPNLFKHSAKGRPGHRGLWSKGLEPRRPEIFLTAGGLEIREQELADGRAVEWSPLADEGSIPDR